MTSPPDTHKNNLHKSLGFEVVTDWLKTKNRTPFQFQEECWKAIHKGKSGLVNAPTGCGKTFAVFLGAIVQFINHHPKDYKHKSKNGIQLIWITPLRALAKDIGRAMEEVITDLELSWKVGIRNGDTETKERAAQRRQMPEVLIITPESLHLVLGLIGYPDFLASLKILAVDEWHELLGSKRGVQVELAISRIVGILKKKSDIPLSLWGISATIGNLEEAKNVLLAPAEQRGELIKADLDKLVEVVSIFPDEIEKYPWSGHLGIKLVQKVLPILMNSTTTLIFINTRGMSELWYQALLDAAPDLAGAIALHHGSIDRELRDWVEENLHTGKLKAVVCTASLDLGVDFRPVETVIQVGSPKGVARFLQRAGRSGHQPDAISKIYFLPTHSLELMEAAALKQAITEKIIETKPPKILCHDVLIQYCCTLALAEGFEPETIFHEIKTTHCFAELSRDEWDEIGLHITQGGKALQQYDEYKKLEWHDDRYLIANRKMAMRHRMHIGTIVSDAMLKVKQLSGAYVGVIEEYFVSKMDPGDVFTLAGRNWELIQIKEMTVLVKKSSATKSQVPSWMGGRMPLSANLGKKLREQISLYCQAMSAVSKSKKPSLEPELIALEPLFKLQQHLSALPKVDELLIEHIETKDGYHLFVYPFEGRLVHEAMAAILAYRISKIKPITFSFAMNDYGFELLSDQPIPVDDTNAYELFSPDNLLIDIQKSVNSTEMAKRKFRDISVIGGLIFQGFPGEQKKARHLQSSASLLFKVFSEYDPQNLLLKQAFQEVMEQQMEEERLREMLLRIQSSKIILTFPTRLTPFCFPIKVDSMREDLSSEKLEDRVRKMILQQGSIL
jgi:ATP-dependent Lhr-like helicase